jgi:hypothetical protein
MAGVEAVALSRRFNQFIQGEGRFRPLTRQTDFRATNESTKSYVPPLGVRGRVGVCQGQMGDAL